MATKRPHSTLHQGSSSSSEDLSEGKQEEEHHHLPPNLKLTSKPTDKAQTQAQPQTPLSPCTEYPNKKKKKNKKSNVEENRSPSIANEQEEDRSPNPKPMDLNSEARSSVTLRKSGRKPVTKKSTHDDDFTDEDEDEEEDEKKTGKQLKKIWSADEEIEILKGLADFTSKGNPLNIKKFYNGKKKSINATYPQVRHKVRKMREKYQFNVQKLNYGGINCDFIFPKPHKRLVFFLSARVWGNSNDKVATEHALREMELIQKSKNEELEQKMKKLRVKEMELFVKRWQIIKELSMLILEAYNNSIAK